MRTKDVNKCAKILLLNVQSKFYLVFATMLFTSIILKYVF